MLSQGKSWIESKNYENFKFYQEDIRTTEIIVKEKPVKIVHLAAMAGIRNSINNPGLYANVNINGFINIMEQAKKIGIKLLIYASSSSVYGLNKKIPFSEDDTIETCNSPYAFSKLSMENFAKMYFQLYKIHNIGLRFFTVYGPRGRPDMAPYKFLKSIITNSPITKYGEGLSSRDYTYIDDVVNGIELCLENKNNLKNEIINLGNSKPVILNNFINQCEIVSQKKAIINQIERQMGDAEHTCADIRKAQNLLGYQPKIDIKTGLKKTYDWMIKLGV